MDYNSRDLVCEKNEGTSEEGQDSQNESKEETNEESSKEEIENI